MALPLESFGEAEDASIFEQVHAQATRASTVQMAGDLNRVLTGRLVAYIAGVKDARTVGRWASGGISDMRLPSEQRLRAAYEIMTLLLRFEGPGTVRAWFIGINPILGDDSPADAIRKGSFQQAMAAARNFVAYG